MSLLNYKEIVKSSVCSIQTKDYMLHKCKQCPKVNGIRKFLKANNHVVNDNIIKYSNWVTISIRTENSESSSNTRVTLKNF